MIWAHGGWGRGRCGEWEAEKKMKVMNGLKESHTILQMTSSSLNSFVGNEWIILTCLFCLIFPSNHILVSWLYLLFVKQKMRGWWIRAIVDGNFTCVFGYCLLFFTFAGSKVFFFCVLKDVNTLKFVQLAIV